MAKQNVLTRSKKIKAAQSYQGGRLQEADRLYQSICQIDPTDAQAWAMRGSIQRQLGVLGEAEKHCRRAVLLQPSLGAAHLELGATLQCLGKYNDALYCYRKAVQLQPDLPEAYFYIGNILRESGNLKEATEHYRCAIRLQPDFAEALTNLGALRTIADDLTEASKFLNKAHTLKPNSPQVLCNLGRLAMHDHRSLEAIEKYRQALQLDPNLVDAISELATLLEKSNHFDEATTLINHGLTIEPNNLQLALVAAKLDRRAGRITEAIQRIEITIAHNPDSLLLGPAHSLLGQLYDRMDEPDVAFKHFIEGNRLTSEFEKKIGREFPSYIEYIRKMSGYLTSIQKPSSITQEAKKPNQEPVFLMGFMRSGTTLLEQVLDSHPRLQSMEERPTVDAMVRAFEEMTRGRENALANLSEEEITKLRAVYFREAAHYVKLQPGNLLVDKNPLNTVHAHLIWRIFPEAKFILAIRHPSDVCLSCFMQDFKVNIATAPFLNLEQGAEVYAEVIKLWQETVQTLPINYHRIRYEDLVADFEAEAQALLDFLGQEWRDEVLGYADHARKRGTVNTASYHQVTQPIYQHAKYRWKRYEKQLAGIIPTLQPFIKYFGYADK